MKAKITAILPALALLFIASPVFGEVLYWPQVCQDGELFVKNRTAQTLYVWLQKFAPELESETDYELPPENTVTIKLTGTRALEHYSLLHFNSPANIDVRYRCGGVIYGSSTLEGGALTFRRSALPDNKIWLQNLYTGVNRVEIELLDGGFRTLTTLALDAAAGEGLTFALPNAVKWSYFRLRSSNKSSVFNLTSGGAEGPWLVAPQESPVDTAASYFLVTPYSGRGDSFIARIRDPQMADRARDLIRNPQKEQMLFATIEKNHQGYNRNWSKREKNFWSWSVTEVTNFADFGSTACNGTPQEVEDRVDFKVQNPGRICFWDYRVKKELTPAEVSSGLAAAPATR